MRLDRLEPTHLIDPAPPVPVVTVPLRRPRWRIVTIAIRLTVWMLREIQNRLTGADDAAARGRRMKELLEGLGGMWVKVGQLLSLRIDLFSVDFCDELAHLQDRVRGFPGLDAQRVIEDELGRPCADVFATFDLRPVAAASIGQVHRATLHDGRTVAIKVRRPFVEESMAQELSLLRALVWLLTRLRVAPFMRWRTMQWEIEGILREELDYRREASAMRRLRANLKRRGMYVPRVHPELSTARVLVMEFISGVLMSDYIATLHRDPERVKAWQRTNNVNPKRLVLRFSLAILRQIIEDNLYHGDLHPGNVVLLRNSRVALLDFGTVGTTDREFLEYFSGLMQAMSEREYERAVDFALLMTGLLPRVDLASVRAEAGRELLAWGRRSDVPSLPYAVKSVDAVYVAISQTFFRYRVTFQWAFLRIRRTLATMDATAMHLDPDANYTDVMQLYFRHARRRAFQSRARSALARMAGTLLVSGKDFDRQIAELAQLALQIERRRLSSGTRALSRATNILVGAARLARLLAVGSLTVALAALAAQHGASWLRDTAVWTSACFVTRVPVWDWQTWAAVIIVSLAAAHGAARIAVRS